MMQLIHYTTINADGQPTEQLTVQDSRLPAPAGVIIDAVSIEPGAETGDEWRAPYTVCRSVLAKRLTIGQVAAVMPDLLAWNANIAEYLCQPLRALADEHTSGNEPIDWLLDATPVITANILAGRSLTVEADGSVRSHKTWCDLPNSFPALGSLPDIASIIKGVTEESGVSATLYALSNLVRLVGRDFAAAVALYIHPDYATLIRNRGYVFFLSTDDACSVAIGDDTPILPGSYWMANMRHADYDARMVEWLNTLHGVTARLTQGVDRFNDSICSDACATVRRIWDSLPQNQYA